MPRSAFIRDFPYRLDKYGAHAGSASEVVVIAAFQVPAITDPQAENQGNVIAITDFGLSVDKGSTKTRVQLQKSADGNNWTTVARISIGDNGNYHRTYQTPIYVTAGQYVRVIGQQDTTGGFSVELKGKTQNLDIVDI